MKMYNLDDIIKIYFKHTTAKEVLNDIVKYDNYPEEVFKSKALMFMKHYSDTEDLGLYTYAKERLHINTYSNVEYEGVKTGVFGALGYLANQLLIMQGDHVLCKYSQFIRWRNLTNMIGETSLICAFLALRFAKGLERHRSFLWNVSLGHNNVQLNKLLQQGIADNHFHLYGSASVFEFVWLKLMNNVTEWKHYKELKEIEKRRRIEDRYNSITGVKESLDLQYIQAAMIRIVLTIFMLEKEGMADAREILAQYGYSEEKIDYILRNSDVIRDEVSTIQNIIGELKDKAVFEKSISETDYAMYCPAWHGADDEQYNVMFSGERWLLYKVLENLYSGNETDSYIYKWLYAYILIKEDIRAELQQVNATVGFENFSVYSGRKGQFLTAHLDRVKMAREAVCGSICMGNIRSLEIRIKPMDTACDNARQIENLDGIITKDVYGKGDNSRFYYVFHFAKERDILIERDDYWGGSCRHYKQRKIYAKQAGAIIGLRNRYPRYAKRVLGIDACAQEIGCRPEVFGPVFRKLGQHICVEEEHAEVYQLKKTFHVGEDFLDIVDGLRAVEECVRFLNFQCGDRIGHGTVLGIDVYKWYCFKNNTIIIPKQDYLDNVVWLYHKLIEFQIENCETLKGYLLKEFSIYFSDIYLKGLRKEEREYLYNLECYHFDIYNYYNAWKLRGDEPELYKLKLEVYKDIQETYKVGILSEDSFWDIDESAKENWHKENEEIRNNIESVLLYYFYHYSWEIRNEGNKMKEIHIPSYYIEGVAKVQKEMQGFMNTHGIGIETNPTSNLLISTMSGYEEHPILKFYNKDLTLDSKESEECRQLYVSINTDDKGVFHTTIENEYAFLACSLEQLKDKNGKPKYNRQMVYQWLDNIRQMGLMQSFMDEII